jgi:hypothetical protein
MSNRKLNFIYALIDPRDKRIRYIGIAVDVKIRYRAHLRDNYQSPKANWIKSLASKGLKPKLKILEVTIDRNRELFWIKKYGRDNLLNLTDGGEGTLGRIVSKETRDRVSSKLAGVKPCKEAFENSPVLKPGWYHTKEARRRIVVAQLGGKRSEAAKQRMRESQLGKVLSAEHRKKISVAVNGNKSHLGLTFSDESKRKMSLARSNWWRAKREQSN